jgi:hypothetical protein
MKRCAYVLALALSAASLSAPSVQAQATLPAGFEPVPRVFPQAARRGTLVVVAPPEILMDGKPERLSPGARIRDPKNRLILSGTLAGQEVLVNYVRDALGLVHEVWIITEAEARQRRPGTETSNFSAESDQNATPRDDGRTPFNQLPRFGQPQR